MTTSIALGAHRDPDGVIVGERVGERAEAADAIEYRAPQRDGGAAARLRQTEADRGDGLRQELRVDGERRKPRPQPFAADAVIEAGHRADVRPRQHRRDRAQIVRSDHDVAVGQHQRVVADARHDVDQVRHLAIDAVNPRIDHEFQRRGRRPGVDRPDDGDRRRVAVLRAAQDLDLAVVVLAAEAQQPPRQAGL